MIPWFASYVESLFSEVIIITSQFLHFPHFLIKAWLGFVLSHHKYTTLDTTVPPHGKYDSPTFCLKRVSSSISAISIYDCSFSLYLLWERQWCKNVERWRNTWLNQGSSDLQSNAPTTMLFRLWWNTAVVVSWRLKAPWDTDEAFFVAMSEKKEMVVQLHFQMEKGYREPKSCSLVY